MAIVFKTISYMVDSYINPSLRFNTYILSLLVTLCLISIFVDYDCHFSHIVIDGLHERVGHPCQSAPPAHYQVYLCLYNLHIVVCVCVCVCVKSNI